MIRAGMEALFYRKCIDVIAEAIRQHLLSLASRNVGKVENFSNLNPIRSWKP
jgi:hypothetical protein